MSTQDRCVCGHTRLNHPADGTCNPGSRRCGCLGYKPKPKDAMAALQNTDIPRDRFGRPMILAPDGKKRIPYRRCTTFVGCLDDMNGLMKWKARQVAYGMGQRSDLVLAAAAANPDDKTKLHDIAEKAAEAAKSSAAADIGTALHGLTERIDRGQELGAVPAEYQPDLEAYRQATKSIEWLDIETFRVHDDWQVAGTADRIGLWRGRPTIMDIKTGSIDYPAKMSMQLAMYSRMVPYDIATDSRTHDRQPVDPNYGIIIHLPAGQGVCNLYEIDLTKGWGACLIARKVWAWRATKNLTRQVDPHADPIQPASWESLIANADDLDRLRELWNRAKELGELTPALKALAQARSRELAA